MNTVIDVQHVTKRFGKETVLSDVTVGFERGHIHGIVGRNGSGKTVLMKCILGFLQPSEGSISVLGQQIGRDCDFAPQTGMIIETPGFIPTESGRHNLQWLLGLLRGDKVKLMEEAMRTVGLDPSSRKPVGKYSLGMRQRLGIAQALMEKPQILVLDEPMNGLDNRGVEEFRKLFLHLRDEGVTILLASHNPLDIAELCDTVYKMDAGRLSVKKN